jgi:hypothetical protein
VIATGFFEAAMPSRVDQHAELVHARHHLPAQAAQARVGGLQAAVPEQVPPVVGELDDLHPELAEQIHPAGIVADRGRVLEAVDEAQPAALAGLFQVRRRLYLHQHVGMGVDLPFPVPDPAEGLLEHVRAAAEGADRQVRRRDPGGADVGELLRGQPVLAPAGPAQRVDHHGAAVARPPDRGLGGGRSVAPPGDRRQGRVGRGGGGKEEETPSVERPAAGSRRAHGCLRFRAHSLASMLMMIMLQ